MDLKDIEFFKKEGDFEGAKATVHNTGRLGFNGIAATKIGFENMKFFQIGRKKGDEASVLFMFPVDKDSEYAFIVQKTGSSWTVNVKQLLKELGIEYEKMDEYVIFDIDEKKDGDGKKYYMLTRRKKKDVNKV
jgi:predicted transcriptional regulator with HTH domain